MIYRKLTAEGDYTFGHGASNFFSGVEAIAQAVKTRLDLYQGTFWRDLSDGLPMFQQILGSSGSEQHRSAVDQIIVQRVRETQGVTQVLGINSTWDPQTRHYGFDCTIQTEDSVTIISGAF